MAYCPVGLPPTIDAEKIDQITAARAAVASKVIGVPHVQCAPLDPDGYVGVDWLSAPRSAIDYEVAILAPLTIAFNDQTVLRNARRGTSRKAQDREPVGTGSPAAAPDCETMIAQFTRATATFGSLLPAMQNELAKKQSNTFATDVGDPTSKSGGVPGVICPVLSDPKSLLFWI